MLKTAVTCIFLFFADVLCFWGMSSGDPAWLFLAVVVWGILVPVFSTVGGIYGFLWMTDESPFALKPTPEDLGEPNEMPQLWKRLKQLRRGTLDQWLGVVSRLFLAAGAVYLVGALLSFTFGPLKFVGQVLTVRLEVAAGMALFVVPLLYGLSAAARSARPLVVKTMMVYAAGIGMHYLVSAQHTSLAEFLATLIAMAEYPHLFGYPIMVSSTVWFFLSRDSAEPQPVAA